MIKLHIFNMTEFLRIVNSGKGAVYVVHGDGKKGNMTRQGDVQRTLIRKHEANKRHLPLMLEIADPGDYMRIVLFTIGDC